MLSDVLKLSIDLPGLEGATTTRIKNYGNGVKLCLKKKIKPLISVSDRKL